MSIPRRLVRTVPAETSVEADALWHRAMQMHPDWQHIDLRDPVDPELFPLTSLYWDTCESGAQLADLIRAEELFARGGCYIDSDYEVFRPLDVLCQQQAWAGWEDSRHICNAAIGFRPGHLGLGEYIQQAIARHHMGTWAAGVGTFTEVFKDRTDILLLPPESLYPVHYSNKHTIDRTMAAANPSEMWPWAFGIHRWRHSWKEKTA